MGSTAKVGVADTIWGLYRKKGSNRGELSITGRDVRERDLVVEFRPTPAAWQLVGDAGEVGRTAAQQRYLDAISELGPSDAEAVAAYLDVTRQSAAEVLRRISEDGKLLASSVKGTGRPRVVYDLPSRARTWGGASKAAKPSKVRDDPWEGQWWAE
jgi:hypothetical protein